MENSSGDEDGERRRETGLRTVSETRMKDGNGDGTEDGSGYDDGERRRARGVRGAPRKAL